MVNPADRNEQRSPEFWRSWSDVSPVKLLDALLGLIIGLAILFCFAAAARDEYLASALFLAVASWSISVIYRNRTKAIQ